MPQGTDAGRLIAKPGSSRKAGSVTVTAAAHARVLLAGDQKSGLQERWLGCDEGRLTMGARNGTSAALVDEVYRTYRVDDRGPMLALLLDDVVFRIEGDPERLPFTGLWHGHAGVNEHLDRLDAEWGDSTVRARRPGHRRGPRSRPGRHALAPQRQRAGGRTHQDRLLDDP